MAYTYYTGQGPDALLVTQPSSGDNVATGDEAIRQIKVLLDDETWFKYTDPAGSLIFNTGAADVDFQMKGASDADLFFLDASTNRVGISTSSPDALLDVAGDMIVGDGSASTDLTLKTGGTNVSSIDFDNGGVDVRIQHDYANSTFKIYTGGDMSTEAILINDTGLVSFSSCPTSTLRIDDAFNTGTVNMATPAGTIKVRVGVTDKYIQLYSVYVP